MDVFAALADSTRRDVLRQLARAGEARVVDLAAEHPITRPAISRHLRVLARAGLVAAEERGRERHYRLETGPLAEVGRLLSDLGSVAVRPEPRRPLITRRDLDALDTEVRRTTRDRRTEARLAVDGSPVGAHQEESA